MIAPLSPLFIHLSVCVRAHSVASAVCDPMDRSPPGSSVHGILQATILERVAISFSRGSSRPRDQFCVSFTSSIGRRFFTISSELSLLLDLNFFNKAVFPENQIAQTH